MSENKVQITETHTHVEIVETQPGSSNRGVETTTIVEVDESSPVVQVSSPATNVVEIATVVKEIVVVPQQSIQVVTVAEQGPAGPAGGGGGVDPDGEIHLTPKVGSTGPEGTVFYASDDDHIYVGTE